MAYNYSKGNRKFGDITAEGDAEGNTKIDFEEDYIALETSGSAVLVVSGSKVGIGTTTPDYELDVAGDIGVNQYIRHNDDTNTHINFTDDKIVLKAGGKAMITMEEKGSAPHEITLNDGGNNIDLVVKGNGSNAGNPGMFFDASNNRVGINGVGSPSWELDVDGDIGLSEYIYHKGDDDTYIRFQDNDVRVATAGSTRLKISGSQGQVTFNEAFTFPHSDGNRDQVLATDGDGAVSWVDPGGASANSEVLMVHLSSDFAYDTSGDNEFQTVPFNSILKSTFGGSDFNTDTSTFTAPEEGFYFINLTLYQQSINTDTDQYQVRISSSTDWSESFGAIAFRNMFPAALGTGVTAHTHRLDRVAHLSGSDEVKITFRNIRSGTESGTEIRHEPHLSYLTIQKL